MNRQALIQFGIEYGQALFSCFTKYCLFDGRTNRKDFWYFVSFGVLIVVAARGVDVIVFDFGDDRWLGPVVLTSLLFLLLPGSAAIVRRLHDINKGGGWHLVYLLCSAGAFFFAVILWSANETIGFAICVSLWGSASVWLAYQLAKEGGGAPNEFGNPPQV